MGTTTDYKEKYLKSFFKWQNSYESACQKVRELEKQLEIAVEALKCYADKKNWEDCYINIPNKGNLCDVLINGAFKSNGYEEAQQALKEMSL